MRIKLVEDNKESSFVKDLQQFRDTIDFEELNNHISELIDQKVNLVITSSNMTTSNRGARLYITLEDPTNFAGDCGILSSILKEVKIVSNVSNIDLGIEGRVRYRCSISILYTFKNNAENDNPLCEAVFENGTWQFDDRFTII